MTEEEQTVFMEEEPSENKQSFVVDIVHMEVYADLTERIVIMSFKDIFGGEHGAVITPDEGLIIGHSIIDAARRAQEGEVDEDGIN